MRPDQHPNFEETQNASVEYVDGWCLKFDGLRHGHHVHGVDHVEKIIAARSFDTYVVDMARGAHRPHGCSLAATAYRRLLRRR